MWSFVDRSCPGDAAEVSNAMLIPPSPGELGLGSVLLSCPQLSGEGGPEVAGSQCMIAGKWFSC